MVLLLGQQIGVDTNAFVKVAPALPISCRVLLSGFMPYMSQSRSSVKMRIILGCEAGAARIAPSNKENNSIFSLLSQTTLLASKWSTYNVNANTTRQTLHTNLVSLFKATIKVNLDSSSQVLILIMQLNRLCNCIHPL